MRAVAILLFLLPTCLPAQLLLSFFNNGAERPVSIVAYLGTFETPQVIDVVFRLRNIGPDAATLESVTVLGTGFEPLSSPDTPLSIPANGSVDFTVRFRPQSEGGYNAILTVNHMDTYLVRGTVLTNGVLLPEPEIVVSPVANGGRGTVAVRFASAAPANGTGQLRIIFTPSVADVSDDPGVQFLATGSRVIPFTVDEGSSTARFGQRQEAEFQAGTTAGTLTFIAQAGSEVEQVSVPLPPAAVAIDSFKVSRRPDGLEVRISGFDNSRSLSRIDFRFFDRKGRAIGGPIQVDVAGEFRRYYETSAVGGLFTLRAVFPVTGNTDGITGLELEIINSMGTSRSERLRF